MNHYCWRHPPYRYPNDSDRSQMPYELNEFGAAKNTSDVNYAEENYKITYFRGITIVFLVAALLFKVSGL